MSTKSCWQEDRSVCVGRAGFEGNKTPEAHTLAPQLRAFSSQLRRQQLAQARCSFGPPLSDAETHLSIVSLFPPVRL